MKLIKITSVIILAAMFMSLMSLSVLATVIDFSKDDFVMGGLGGQGVMNIINDGDRRVVFVEVEGGYDPDDDPDSSLGDVYASVEDFADYGVDGSVHKYMKARIKNDSNAPHFEIHFASPNQGYSVATSVTFDINPNSDYTDYVWNVEEYSKKYYPKRPADVSDPDNWPNHWEEGPIGQLRLDFMYYEESGGRARTGDKIYVEYIAFFETEAAANAFTFTPARTPAQIEEAKAAADAEREAAAAERAAELEAAAAAADADTADEVDADDDDAADGEEADTPAPANNNNTDDDSGGMAMWIVIALIVLAVIIVIVVLVSKSKAKPEDK